VSLDIIGAGFGRTGTLSLKIALERLGSGRCYHMLELFERPDQARYWLAAADGGPAQWDELFAGYRATVDWPGCTFWRELLTLNPTAKVILTERPEADWCASFRSTIAAALDGEPPPPEAPFHAVRQVGQRIVKELTFGGAFGEDGELIARYRQHNQAVRGGVPAGQLLVLDLSEGWEPLCRFLGTDVPDEPFPRVNDRAEFRQRAGLDPPLDAGAPSASGPSGQPAP
jgi:hypothetical protein